MKKSQQKPSLLIRQAAIEDIPYIKDLSFKVYMKQGGYTEEQLLGFLDRSIISLKDSLLRNIMERLSAIAPLSLSPKIRLCNGILGVKSQATAIALPIIQKGIIYTG